MGRTVHSGTSSVHLVRQHILEILKERSGATVSELAERLDMAPVSVRHHLDILQGDNLICVERLARTGAVGRPQQVYALTQHAGSYFPDNFAALASGLLRKMRDALPQERFEGALKSIAREFGAQLRAEDAAAPITCDRLDRIVQFLNERGYLARWEREGHAGSGGDIDLDGGVILLHKCNCPYAGVSAEHGELCVMDQALIDELVGQHCERVHSLAEDDPCCTYRIVLSPRVQVQPAADGRVAVR